MATELDEQQQAAEELKPPELRLECYTFTVHKRHSRREDVDRFLKFDDILDGTFRTSTGENETRRMNFQELFEAFIKSFNNQFAVDRSAKAINIKADTVTFDSGRRTICGLVEGGNTNMGGFVKDKTNMGDEFELTLDHVAGRPYYFLLYMPSDSNTGILVFQSYSNESFSDSFKRKIQNFVGANNGPVLTFQTHIAEEVVENFKEHSKIEKISIYKQSVSSDRGSSIFAQEFNPDVSFNIELKVTGANALNRINERIQGYLSGENEDSRFFSMEELGDIGFDDQSEVKFTFKHGNKTNTVTSRNSFSFSPNYYVEEGDVRRDNNFLPILEDIESYCNDYLEQLKRVIK